jgi:subtilisin
LAVLFLLAVSARAQQFCPLSAADSAQRLVLCKPSVTLDACRAAAQTAGCAVVRELPSINAIVIKIPKNRVSLQEARLMGRTEVLTVEADDKINWLKSADFVLPSPSAVMAPFVSSAAKKTAKSATGPQIPWGIQRVNAPAAWPTTQGARVKIAVIDTGIDSTHPDLKANVAGGWNATDAVNPGNFMDDQGHGTHVSGTIAAVGITGGVVGVAPQASLYGVKVLDKDGNGTISDVIAGIDWAVKNHMDVVNMSLGADSGSDALHQEVQAAVNAGVVIVAAAGNANGGPLSFPGAYPEAIAVSASDENDHFASYSSAGAGVTFIAPGSNVLSTIIGGKYGLDTGTSMATPHVSGLAALAISSGAHGAAAVRSALQSAASPLPGLSASQEGAGMIDAGKLVGASMLATTP